MVNKLINNFNPATMNPASIVLENFSNNDNDNNFNYIIIVILILLCIGLFIYIRNTRTNS
jgi:hypothetical protein